MPGEKERDRLNFYPDAVTDLAHNGHLGLPEAVLSPATRTGGAPPDYEGTAGSQERGEVLVVVVVGQTGSSAVQSTEVQTQSHGSY